MLIVCILLVDSLSQVDMLSCAILQIFSSKQLLLNKNI